MFNTSVIEVSKSALINNYKIIRECVGEDVKVSSVVKGNAYGHGIEDFVPVAEECGMDHFSVFSTDEAYRVKKSLINPETQVMIMGWVDNDELEWVIKNDVQFYVFDLDRLNKLIEVSSTLKKKARIHFEIETGMNRTGFIGDELRKAVEKIKDNPQCVEMVGLCTHFAGAESVANYLRVKNQYSNFKRIARWMKNHGIVPQVRHVASSAASIAYPNSRLDLVRIGIMQYGLWPSQEILIHYLKNSGKKNDPLKRIISWKSKVMSTKEVGKGDFIGYGTTYQARDHMKVATVPIGYSHGYSRSLSNTGRILVNNSRVAVIGIVNMNMLMIDISEIPGIKKGDEVVLIGGEGPNAVSVSAFGELSDQLNYELLTRLPSHIPRKIVD